MDKEISIVLSKENTDYRKVAQINWGLSDEQMSGKHVHHEPPKALGGRNIPEHLYVCSPDMHQEGWHKGASFPKLASEGGKLSAIVRRKKAKEIAGLSKEDQAKLREQRKKNRESKKNKRERQAQKKLEKLTTLRLRLSLKNLWSCDASLDDEKYKSMVKQLVDESLLVPEGLLL
jgi:hypothetical protein